ncbi:MAG: hypothetical protein JW814_00605 [Candidatus Krumholzibacteriota bacterium]|nr:hypothetical protein [Candidatus Krumholzibacteriota bacterium]
MFKGKVLLFSLLLVFATSLYAGDVDPCQSEFGVSCTGMRVSICPAGDFEWIYDGCGNGNDYIWLYARDASGNGIEGIPWTDYWMNACDPAQELSLCSAPFAADALTDEFGYTEISGRISGGGCILSGGIYLAIQGKTIVDMPGCVDVTCVDIQIISPDLIPTGEVDLSDFSIFGDAYNTADGDAMYDDCCDYNGDKIINLSDFAFFGEHYLHECF